LRIFWRHQKHSIAQKVAMRFVIIIPAAQLLIGGCKSFFRRIAMTAIDASNSMRAKPLALSSASLKLTWAQRA
jgi:hypothetical protein